MANYDRHISLEGSVNFRDLGGYPAADGRTVRWRTLFRADGLSHLTRSDRAVVRQLGIATVVDLRSPTELEGDRFPVDEIPVGFHHVPLVTKLASIDDFRRVPGFLAARYLQFIGESGERIAQAVSIVAERHAHPVIVHCTAGKDRTGVVVAVILALLGVPDETIAQDYALSGQAMVHLKARLLERYPENRDAIERMGDSVLSATPDNILVALETVRADYGSVEGYITAKGARPGMVAALRDTLLE